MCYVYTIGYESRSLDSFLDSLAQNHIEQVIDVRQVPMSRKPGFSKGKLSSSLENAGISYVHVKELGSSKEMRERLHKTKDYDTFFFAYRYYLSTHFSLVQQTWELATQKRTCLLCFEKKPSECHRSVIAEYLHTSMPNVDGVINL